MTLIDTLSECFISLCVCVYACVCVSPILHACKKNSMGVCVGCEVFVCDSVWGCRCGCLCRGPSLSAVCVSVCLCVCVWPYVDVWRKKPWVSVCFLFNFHCREHVWEIESSLPSMDFSPRCLVWVLCFCVCLCVCVCVYVCVWRTLCMRVKKDHGALRVFVLYMCAVVPNCLTLLRWCQVCMPLLGT